MTDNARTFLRDVVQDRAGNPIQNAAVYVFAADTGSRVSDHGTPTGTAVTLYDGETSSAGVLSNPLLTNADGIWSAWADTPGPYDRIVTDNAGTAYYASTPATHLSYVNEPVVQFGGHLHIVQGQQVLWLDALTGSDTKYGAYWSGHHDAPLASPVAAFNLITGDSANVGKSTYTPVYPGTTGFTSSQAWEVRMRGGPLAIVPAATGYTSNPQQTFTVAAPLNVPSRVRLIGNGGANAINDKASTLITNSGAFSSAITTAAPLLGRRPSLLVFNRQSYGENFAVVNTSGTGATMISYMTELRNVVAHHCQWDGFVFTTNGGDGGRISQSFAYNNGNAGFHTEWNVDSTGTASMTSGSAVLTATSGSFASSSVNDFVFVEGAGAGGADLYSAIQVKTDSTHVTLFDTAGTNTPAYAYWAASPVADSPNFVTFDGCRAQGNAFADFLHDSFGPGDTNGGNTVEYHRCEAFGLGSPGFMVRGGHGFRWTGVTYLENNLTNGADAPMFVFRGVGSLALARSSALWTVANTWAQFMDVGGADCHGFAVTAAGTDKSGTKGSITAGSNVFTCAAPDSTFASSDVGRTVIIAGAGLGGRTMRSSVQNFSSATSVVLNNYALTTVNGTATWNINSFATSGYTGRHLDAREAEQIHVHDMMNRGSNALSTALPAFYFGTNTRGKTIELPMVINVARAPQTSNLALFFKDDGS